MLTLMFCLRRKAGLDRAEFQLYWREQHGPRMAARFRALGALGYRQLHTLEGGLADAVAASRGGPEPFDGIAEVWWTDRAAFQAATDAAAGRQAGQDLLADEANFIDFAASPIFLAETRFGLGDGRAAVTAP